MKKQKSNTQNTQENPGAQTPEFYWTQGLGDAHICSVTEDEIPRSAVRLPGDNCLTLQLDCEGALFEQDITEIRLFDYKILTDDFDLSLLNGGWWLRDELTDKGGHYDLRLKFDTEDCCTRVVEICFSRAEVIRKE